MLSPLVLPITGTRTEGVFVTLYFCSLVETSWKEDPAERASQFQNNAWFGMEGRMFFPSHNLEILDPIISLVLVQMMYDLIILQQPA